MAMIVLFLSGVKIAGFCRKQAEAYGCMKQVIAAFYFAHNKRLQTDSFLMQGLDRQAVFVI